MEVAKVAAQIKEIIANVAGIEVESITDTASFMDDLQLDSLSLLEIGVDVDYAFKLGVPEEELQDLRTVHDTVNLVMHHLRARQPMEAVA